MYATKQFAANAGKKFGSREEVMAGIASMTKGHLQKKDLFVDPKDGKIKSKKKSAMARKQLAMNGGRFVQTAARKSPMGGSVAKFRADLDKFLNAQLSARGISPNLQGAAIVANIQGAGKAKEFLKKILKAAKKVLGKTADFMTGPQISKLANLISQGLIASGVPKLAIAGMTIQSLTPVVQKALEPFRSEHIGAGVLLPGAGVMLPGQGF